MKGSLAIHFQFKIHTVTLWHSLNCTRALLLAIADKKIRPKHITHWSCLLQNHYRAWPRHEFGQVVIQVGFIYPEYTLSPHKLDQNWRINEGLREQDFNLIGLHFLATTHSRNLSQVATHSILPPVWVGFSFTGLYLFI